MEAINSAFFFVIDKIVDLQVYFWKQAWNIGKIVLSIALATAAINYALTGEGLKSNIIKIGKALVFFIVIMTVYPRIIGHITKWTFDTARDSTYTSIERYLTESKEAIAQEITQETEGVKIKETYGSVVLKSEKVSEDGNPMLYFSQILQERQHGDITYTVVAPAAALEVVLLVAGECFRSAEEAPKAGILPDFYRIITGAVCGFFVILTGVFAVLEYLIAFLEYMLIAGVGIILFPLSLWEGSKFMSEKFIGALTGFFIKLLFSNICIFLMLYGFMSLAKTYTLKPFTGLADEVVTVIFVSLLFFYICKSAPGLAQSLLTGTPSLSATGAVSAMAGAGAAAMGAAKLAGQAGGAIAGGTAKFGFGTAGALQQAGAAAGAVKELGGGGGSQIGAFMGSMGHSAGESAKAGAGDLARSLLGGGKSGSAAGGGSGAGINRHSQRQQFLGEKNADGTKKTFGEQAAGRRAAGTNAGLDYMAKKEAGQQARQSEAAQKQAGAAQNAAFSKNLSGLADAAGKQQERAAETQKRDDRAAAASRLRNS